jgi:rare lipoprotein A
MMRFGRIALLLTVLAVAPLCHAGETGIGSWYGPGYQGHLTASGAPFDMHQLTAAHRTLPFGTVVRVTNTRNRRTVDLRITDRGPFIDGRVIDLSMAAAERLGFLRSGLAPVRIDILTLAGPRCVRIMTPPLHIESDPPPLATVAIESIPSPREIFSIQALSLTTCSGSGHPQGVLSILPCYKSMRLNASNQPFPTTRTRRAGIAKKAWHTIARTGRYAWKGMRRT